VRVLVIDSRVRWRRWNRKPESVVLCLVTSTIRYSPSTLPEMSPCMQGFSSSEEGEGVHDTGMPAEGSLDRHQTYGITMRRSSRDDLNVKKEMNNPKRSQGRSQRNYPGVQFD
jgi:hypothetical protein